jgi:hypothetical protein
VSFPRDSGLVRLADIDPPNPDVSGPHPDSVYLDRILAFMNATREWNGGDVCEFVAQILVASGREVLDEE